MPRLLLASRLFLLGCGLVVVASLWASQTANGKHAQEQGSAFPSVLAERTIAQQEAINSGSQQYSFKSSFIPGIGKVGDPEAYKNEWESNIKTAKPSDFLPN